LADRVAVIVKGEIVAEGSPGELMAAAGDTIITFRLKDGTSLEGIPLADPSVVGPEVSARTDSPTQTLHDLTGWALARDIELGDLSASQPSLEDVYLELAYDGEIGS
jgi:ABC-2 type transport system ATP-binding protein